MNFGGQEGGGWEKFDQVPTPHVVTNKSIFLFVYFSTTVISSRKILSIERESRIQPDMNL